MNVNKYTLLGALTTILGGALTLFSQYIESKQQEELIENKVYEILNQKEEEA